MGIRIIWFLYNKLYLLPNKYSKEDSILKKDAKIIIKYIDNFLCKYIGIPNRIKLILATKNRLNTQYNNPSKSNVIIFINSIEQIDKNEIKIVDLRLKLLVWSSL